MKLRATDGAFKIIRDNVIIVEATHLGRILVEGGCMRVNIIPSSEWKIPLLLLLLLEFQFDSSLLLDSLFGRKERKRDKDILRNADTAEKEKAYFPVELETRARVFDARFDPVSRARRPERIYSVCVGKRNASVAADFRLFFSGSAEEIGCEGAGGQHRSVVPASHARNHSVEP